MKHLMTAFAVAGLVCGSLAVTPADAKTRAAKGTAMTSVKKCQDTHSKMWTNDGRISATGRCWAEAGYVQHK
jgi:hypothetical protein